MVSQMYENLKFSKTTIKTSYISITICMIKAKQISQLQYLVFQFSFIQTSELAGKRGSVNDLLLDPVP